MRCKIIRVDLADASQETLCDREGRGLCCDYINIYHSRESARLVGRNPIYLIVDLSSREVWQYTPMAHGVVEACEDHKAMISHLLNALIHLDD